MTKSRNHTFMVRMPLVSCCLLCCFCHSILCWLSLCFLSSFFLFISFRLLRVHNYTQTLYCVNAMCASDAMRSWFACDRVSQIGRASPSPSRGSHPIHSVRLSPTFAARQDLSGEPCVRAWVGDDDTMASIGMILPNPVGLNLQTQSSPTGYPIFNNKSNIKLFKNCSTQSTHTHTLKV